MNLNPERMAKLQFLAAVVILALLCFMIAGPMVGLKPPDKDFTELIKAVVLILTGFLFGTSVSGAKKDEQNAALTQKLAAPVAAETQKEVP